MFGSEGHRLVQEILEAVDSVVKVRMGGGVDLLDVTARAAVVFYATQ